MLKRNSADHGAQFLDYYERASVSQTTFDRFNRIQKCALALVESSQGRRDKFDVVDIGCGAGTQALIWAQVGHRVSALDASSALVGVGQRRALERGLDVRFSVGFAQALPYKGESFDVVLMPELLEHVAEWEACLQEAVRILRPRGILYLSTTNKLCPVQQEFELPAYSWYPSRLKHWIEQKSVSTHPQWVNHTKYPAVNWFTYYSLRRWLNMRGVQTMDRFDMLARDRLNISSKVIVAAIRRVPAIRFLAQVATEGTTVWGIKAA